MNNQATTYELQTSFSRGWLGSLALHGLVLFSCFSFIHQSPVTMPPEPFHWDVTLVQATQTTDKPIQHIPATPPIASKPTARTTMPAQAIPTIHPAAPSADPIVPINPQVTEPVTPASHPSIASSTSSPREAPIVSTIETPIPSQPQSTDPLGQQEELPLNSTTTEPSTAQTAAVGPNEPRVSPGETAQPSPWSTTESNTESSSPTRPDYRWLQQAISLRLEELKRSSRPFLDQSEPLRVLVRAVVSHEGALLAAEVVKSSGLNRIDQEAMTLVQRAFPIRLDHSLDRRQIAMRIPITYSRD